MIHDAKVEVTCDGCDDSIEIDPEYVYISSSAGGQIDPEYVYSRAGGHYDTSASAIEKKLENRGWFVEGEKHYCCIDCVPRG